MQLPQLYYCGKGERESAAAYHNNQHNRQPA